MRISYINGLCVEHDAISNSIRDEISWLLESGENEVNLFTYNCCSCDVDHTEVNGINDVAFDPYFQSSDLIVFHFGIFYPLFDLLPVCPKNARRLVVFHNITPKELVSADNYLTIEKSLKQMSNIMFADHVICVSDLNLRILREAGIQTPATVLPLSVPIGKPAPEHKPSIKDKRVRVVFIGRFVSSKGPDELLDAVHRNLQRSSSVRYAVDLIGNLSFSDNVIFEKIRKQIDELIHVFGDRILVTVHGNASNDLKNELLHEADLFVLPTYHEGFCVPVLEAFASGCRVILYENSNTPFISGGLAQLVPTGDVEALSEVMFSVGNEVISTGWTGTKGGYYKYLARTEQYTKQFSSEQIKRRFLKMISGFSNNPL